MKKVEYDEALDKEYLSRALIDVKYEISDSIVKIQNEHTSFVFQQKRDKLKQEDILNLYSEIVKKCREAKIKIHYSNKYKKNVVEHWNLYMETYKEYLKDYEELQRIAKKVEKRGIHMACSDDYLLTELYKKADKINSYFWGGQVMSYMSNVYNELRKLNHQIDFYSNRESGSIVDIYL